MAEYRRELKSSDLLRMRVPSRYWNVSYSEISDGDHREIIGRYLRKINEMKTRGVGLLFWGKNGAGKCVIGDEIVCINGRLSRMRDVYGGQLSLAPIVADIACGNGRTAKTSGFYNDGIQKTHDLVLENGLSISGTACHPVKVWGRLKDSMVPLSEIKDNDLVAVDYSPIIGDGEPDDFVFGDVFDGKIDQEIAALIGWVIAEGSVDSYGVRFSNANMDVCSFVKGVFRERFGIYPSYEDRRERCMDIGYGGKSVAQFFSLMGCGNSSADHVISNTILSSPSSVIAAYLRALFGGDGGISGGSVEYTSKSYRLICDLQRVLLAMGIYSSFSSSMKCATNGSRVKREYWRLRITGEDIISFRDSVGFDSLESDKCKRLSDLSIHVKESEIDCRVLPVNEDDLRLILSSACDAIGTGRGYGKGRAKVDGGLKGILGDRLDALVRSSLSRGVMSVSVMKRFVSLAEQYLSGMPEFERLKMMSVSMVRYVPVKSLKTGLYRTVYDFVVPDGHLFWSSGFISHNTSIAVVIGKEYRRRGNTVLFFEAAALKRAVIQKEMFDDEQSVWERARDVDVLILDDIGKGVQDSTGFGARLLDELIRHRNAHERVTFITTNMSPYSDRTGEPSQLEDELKMSTLHSLKECIVPINVDGPDMRDCAKIELRELLTS